MTKLHKQSNNPSGILNDLLSIIIYSCIVCMYLSVSCGQKLHNWATSPDKCNKYCIASASPA